MRVMVTGGTGYVGAWSVKALVDAGHRVRLLVRDPAKARKVLGALGLQRVPCVAGDMTDEAAVLAALKGCDAVLHCAAVVSTDARRADEMMQANPRGAELVIGHAVRMGLDPVVHVSSIAALLTPGLNRLTADLPLGTLDSGYARSKAAAERYVRGLQDKGAPVVITYPGSVTGPAAGGVISEATEGLAEHVKIGTLMSPDAAWSLIDARDLGAIHAALMEPGQGPRRYMCGGHYLKMDDLAKAFERVTGRDFKVLPLPGALLRMVGRAMDAAARVVSFESVVTHEAMVCYTQMPPTDDAPARRELGVRYRRIDLTLREALLAARDAGLLTDEQLGKLARGRAQR
jgi:nucleoside-diphosphate-sugar epimerase